MNKELENYLLQALKRLEEASAKIMQTQGYSAENEQLKILMEIVKEQGLHENSRNSAR